ncbi:MAG: tetratricopeptide repeat protein, partial [Hellea sp.]|nr:tetratricopeptide repeat protein [Hellea sp.]
QDQGKLEEAIEVYEKALAIKPDYADAHINIGVIFQNQGNCNAAITNYAKALSLEPSNANLRSLKLFQQAKICDWKAVEEDCSLLPELGVFEKAIEPFSVLALEDAPERHRLRSEKYAREHFPVKSTKQFERPSRMPKRLRIGYFSADFHEHPVTYLMSKVINCHDRSLFEIYGYSFGLPKTDVMREKLVKSVDFFRDTYNLSNPEVIELIQKDKIDIAIDLSGYTTNSRSGIFSYRPAPIQINYLGFPGTMGAKFMDYIIADQNLIPTDFQEFYIEKPIYLPHSYQAQDDSLPIADYTPSRSELGLPDCGFVFCAINNTYKITPQEFDIWMRLLQKIKGSVLWLLESNKWAKDNLLKEASIRGIKPERLIFAEKVSHENYLAQFRQADLYLDTFHYNAGATASNALWAGLPVLSKQGKSYTARMASSLLMALDLPELITTSKLEYESVALELAKNPDRLTFLKQKLIINRISKPLFKTKLFTKHLENGYQQAYQRYFNGEEPDTIIVPE